MRLLSAVISLFSLALFSPLVWEMEAPSDWLLAGDVFEPRAETGSEHFAYQGIGLFQISKLMVSSSENIHNNINVLV